MTDASIFPMRLRTGNWGRNNYELRRHAPVVIELAPADAPTVLLRIVDGAREVPRELTSHDVVELSVLTSSGVARLVVAPHKGGVERASHGSTDGVWELTLQGARQDSLHLYADTDTPFPSDEVLDRLAAIDQHGG